MHTSKLVIFLLRLFCSFYGASKCLEKGRMQKFKLFSRSMGNCQVLFKINLVFKGFSRQPFIFQYFSSLYEPCTVRQSTWPNTLQIPIKLHEDILNGYRVMVDTSILTNNNRRGITWKPEDLWSWSAYLRNVDDLNIRFHNVKINLKDCIWTP